VSFADLGGGAEVYVRPTSDGLEFGATWSSPDQTPSVDIILDLQGYDIKVGADGLTLELFERPVEVEPDVLPTPAPTPDPSRAPDETPRPTSAPAPSASPGLSPSPSPSASPPAASPDASPGPSPSPSSPTPSPAPSAPPSPAASPAPSADVSSAPSASTEPSPTPASSEPPAPTAVPEPRPDAPLVGLISAPILLEGSDEQLTSGPVTVEVLPGPEAGQVVVRYALDPAWLAAADRVFPVVLDPDDLRDRRRFGLHDGLRPEHVHRLWTSVDLSESTVAAPGG
jgi:hypothetical protein